MVEWDLNIKGDERFHIVHPYNRVPCTVRFHATRVRRRERRKKTITSKENQILLWRRRRRQRWRKIDNIRRGGAHKRWTAEMRVFVAFIN